jgi:hypothetical protein
LRHRDLCDPEKGATHDQTVAWSLRYVLSQPCELSTIQAGGESLVGKAAVNFAVAYAVTTLAILRLMHLPEIPLLRYVVFVVPVFAAIMLVAYWYELGAPWPAASLRRSRQHPGHAPVSGARPLATRAG